MALKIDGDHLKQSRGMSNPNEHSPQLVSPLAPLKGLGPTPNPGCNKTMSSNIYLTQRQPSPQNNSHHIYATQSTRLIRFHILIPFEKSTTLPKEVISYIICVALVIAFSDIDNVKPEQCRYFTIATIAEPLLLYATVRVLGNGASKDRKNGHIDVLCLMIEF